MDQSELHKQLISLAEELNMEFSDENGQRVFGPPRDWEGPIPPRGSEIHVGRLPRTVFEPTLLPLFLKAGPIYTFRLMMNFSGDNRGYCFVKYSTPEAAENAINMLADCEVEGKVIKIQLSVENRKIFIRPLPLNISTDEVYKELSKHFVGITRIVLKTTSKNGENIERYGFIEFEDHRQAALARKKLLETDEIFWGEELFVDWALPVAPTNRVNGLQPRTLRIMNVNPETTAETLKAIMNEHGNNGVVYVRFKVNFVHVKFDNHANADAVRNRMDGTVIDGSAVRVEWKKLLKRRGPYMKNLRRCREESQSGGSQVVEQQAMMTNIPIVQMVAPGVTGLETFLQPPQSQQVCQAADGAGTYTELFPGQPVQVFQSPGAMLWSCLQPRQPQMYHHGQPQNSGVPPTIDAYYVSGNPDFASEAPQGGVAIPQQAIANPVQGYAPQPMGQPAPGQQVIMMDSQPQVYAPVPVGHGQFLSDGQMIHGFVPHSRGQFILVNQPQGYALPAQFSPMGSPVLNQMVPFSFPPSEIGSALGTFPQYCRMRSM